MVWEWGRADGGEGDVEVSEVPRVCEGAGGDGVVEGGSGAEGVGGAENVKVMYVPPMYCCWADEIIDCGSLAP